MAPPVGLLIGHSFVHGLMAHLKIDNHTTGRAIAKEMNLSRIIQSLHMHGERGAKVCPQAAHSQQYSLPHSLLRRAKPDFVIIDLGTNDLACNIPPFEIATKLFQLATDLITQYHVTAVVICSIINRERHISMTPPEFATAAFQLNNYLKHLAETEPRVMYHPHKGFWDSPVTTWSRDGIHPNATLGRKRYVKSIRKAVFAALQSFTQRV